MTWIHVRGNPAPQGSKQAFVRGRRAVLVETSKRLPAWRIAVQDAALQHLTPIPAGVPVAVEIVFVMPRTKAMGNRPAPPMVQRPDADKLARAVLDGLTGPAFADDSQVVRLVVDKRRADPGEETGARINVEALKPPTPTRCAGEGQTPAAGPK